MFDHVKFGVSDYAASRTFFLKALEPLGVAVVSEGQPEYGVELSSKDQAKQRLKLLLIHDQVDLPPMQLERMKTEILEVVARYCEIDQQQFASFALFHDMCQLVRVDKRMRRSS